MTLRWKDAQFLAGLALTLLSIYILITANRWVLFNAEGPGPGFFPMGYGLIMLGCSLVLIYQRVTMPVDTGPKVARTALDESGFKAALLSWVAIIASVPLMYFFGFVVGFGLAILFMVKVVFQKSWQTSAITAAAIVAALYFVFPTMLGAALPVSKFWNF
jgi:putative tricarboxylic transport membrane protein